MSQPSPELLRLRRVRDELDKANLALANALIELTLADRFAIVTMNAAERTQQALQVVVGSIQALEKAEAEAVK